MAHCENWGAGEGELEKATRITFSRCPERQKNHLPRFEHQRQGSVLPGRLTSNRRMAARTLSSPRRIRASWLFSTRATGKQTVFALGCRFRCVQRAHAPLSARGGRGAGLMGIRFAVTSPALVRFGPFRFDRRPAAGTPANAIQSAAGFARTGGQERALGYGCLFFRRTIGPCWCCNWAAWASFSVTKTILPTLVPALFDVGPPKKNRRARGIGR